MHPDQSALPLTDQRGWLKVIVCGVCPTSEITVESDEVLFQSLTSPPPDTVTLFVRLVLASEATETVTVIAGYEAPAARGSARVQETASVHVHPEPEAAVAVRPVGRLSVTVIDPDDAAFPTFETVNV